jgi:hypothetical protein
MILIFNDKILPLGKKRMLSYAEKLASHTGDTNNGIIIMN